MNLRLQELSDGEFQTMHTAVLDLLAGYGVRFEDQAALDLLVRAGNPADSQGRVHLAPEFVESMLGLVPPHGFLMYGRDEAKVLRVAVDAVGFRPATGAPNVFDYGMRARRKASMGDVRELVTLADALDGFDMVNAVVTPEEAPGGAVNVLGFVESHRFSLKPSDVTVMTAQEVRAIGQISAAIRGSEAQLRERPLTAIDVAMISPLRCAAEQSQCLLECARRGLPIEVLTAPAMGLTAPITLAGSAALAIAEVVAALCLVYLVEPGLGIINTARVQPVNMRTTAVNYGAPELGMASVLVAACCARYRLPCNLYGFGSTAGMPGIQATMERTLSGLLHPTHPDHPPPLPLLRHHRPRPRAITRRAWLRPSGAVRRHPADLARAPG
jgi:trimethylamine--corrinoid protein Co-methyltransferase